MNIPFLLVEVVFCIYSHVNIYSEYNYADPDHGKKENYAISNK